MTMRKLFYKAMFYLAVSIFLLKVLYEVYYINLFTAKEFWICYKNNLIYKGIIFSLIWSVLYKLFGEPYYTKNNIAMIILFFINVFILTNMFLICFALSALLRN